MVSHLVMLADAGGDVAIAERAPGEPMFVRRGRGKVPLTNHFEGPLADDPANRQVEAVTSTRARRLRLDELLAALPPGASADADRRRAPRSPRASAASRSPLGNRRAIDALIATHSVVMDVTARVMWVSEGPHLVGRYLRFDLGRLLDAGFTPRAGRSDRRDPGRPSPDERRATTRGCGPARRTVENRDAPPTTWLPRDPPGPRRRGGPRRHRARRRGGGRARRDHQGAREPPDAGGPVLAGARRSGCSRPP